jgi:hypothetical protein
MFWPNSTRSLRHYCKQPATSKFLELHLTAIVKVKQISSTSRAVIVLNQPRLDAVFVKHVTTVLTDRGTNTRVAVMEWFQTDDAAFLITWLNADSCSSSIIIVLNAAAGWQYCCFVMVRYNVGRLTHTGSLLGA